MRALLAIALALYLDAHVAFWSCACALADRVQNVAAAHFGDAVRRRYP